MFPIPYFTTDGIVNCYPGDDFYPAQPDYTTTKHNPGEHATKSCEQFRALAQNLHRAEMESARPARILHNIQSADNHIAPQTIESAKLWFVFASVVWSFFFCRRGTRAKCYTRLYYYEYSFWGELLSFVDISQQSALLWDFFDRELQFFCKLEFCSDYSHYLLPSFSFSPSPDFLLDKVLPKYAIFV